MLRMWILTICVVATTASGVLAADAKEMIATGVALHDQGKFAEAIAVYRDVLRADPHNERASYELTFSLFSSGALQECVATAEGALRTTKSYRAEFFALHSSCLDDLGRSSEAMRVCKKGVREFPKDSNLAFNCALARIKRQELPEARKLLKISVSGRPLHASSHLMLAKVFAEDGYQVPALLAALRFLSLEPTGQRAKEAAGLARRLLDSGVTKRSEANIDIAIDAKAPKDEGDFVVEAMILSMLSANRFTEDQAKKTESAQVADEVSGFLAFLDETLGEKKKQSFARTAYVPILAAMHRANLAEAFGYFAFLPLELQGSADWAAGHSEEMTKLRSFLEGQNHAGSP